MTHDFEEISHFGTGYKICKICNLIAYKNVISDFSTRYLERADYNLDFNCLNCEEYSSQLQKCLQQLIDIEHDPILLSNECNYYKCQKCLEKFKYIESKWLCVQDSCEILSCDETIMKAALE